MTCENPIFIGHNLKPQMKAKVCEGFSLVVRLDQAPKAGDKVKIDLMFEKSPTGSSFSIHTTTWDSPAICSSQQRKSNLMMKTGPSRLLEKRFMIGVILRLAY